MTDRTKAPKVSHFSDITLQPEELIELDNAVKLHVVRRNDVPMARMQMVWEGGTLDYSNAAATKIMASTLQEATKKTPSEEMADKIDYFGARISGDATMHFVTEDLIVINKRLTEMLPLTAQIASDSLFPENAVASASRRFAVNQAIRLQKVSYCAVSRLRSILQGHGHKASKIELPEDYENVTREKIVETYEKIKKAPLHIFIAGDLDNGIIENLTDLFGALPRAGKSPVNIEPFKPEAPVRETVEMTDTMQSGVAMGFPTIDRTNPDYIALRLAVMGLGGYFGSRLMSNIREEKGLTYGINASLNGYREGAYMEINAQCDRRYVDQVIEETLKEIGNLAENPPRGEELNRLRLHAWSELAVSADSIFGTLEHYITHLRVGTPDDYFRRQLEEISELTAERISEVAKKYLNPEKISIVVAE